MFKELKYHSGNKYKYKLLSLLAFVVIILHAIIPHTSHSRHFNSVVNLLGIDFQNSFNHHESNYEGNHQSSRVFIFQTIVEEKVVSVTNAKIKETKGYPPFYMVDTPPDIISSQILKISYSNITNFNYIGYINSTGGLRAPPAS